MIYGRRSASQFSGTLRSINWKHIHWKLSEASGILCFNLGFEFWCNISGSQLPDVYVPGIWLYLGLMYLGSMNDHHSIALKISTIDRSHSLRVAVLAGICAWSLVAEQTHDYQKILDYCLIVTLVWCFLQGSEENQRDFFLDKYKLEIGSSKVGHVSRACLRDALVTVAVPEHFNCGEN